MKNTTLILLLVLFTSTPLTAQTRSPSGQVRVYTGTEAEAVRSSVPAFAALFESYQEEWRRWNLPPMFILPVGGALVGGLLGMAVSEIGDGTPTGSSISFGAGIGSASLLGLWSAFAIPAIPKTLPAELKLWLHEPTGLTINGAVAQEILNRTTYPPFLTVLLTQDITEIEPGLWVSRINLPEASAFKGMPTFTTRDQHFQVLYRGRQLYVQKITQETYAGLVQAAREREQP